MAYLNMSDPNQQCSSNWTLSIVHGCAYSSVCVRILDYQIRVGAGFGVVLDTGRNTIDAAYVSGLSLTHGPAGSRQHIVTFAAALNKQD